MTTQCYRRPGNSAPAARRNLQGLAFVVAAARGMPMRRVLVRAVVAVTLALPASVLALTAGVPAADAHSSLTCGTVKGRATGEMTVKKCALSSAVNKKAYKELAAFSGTVESGGTLTWKPAGTTTIIS